MADSQRLRSVPEGIQLISEVAAELARRGDIPVTVLGVTTFFPMDVDSIARVLEGLEELDGVDRVQLGKLAAYEIETPERFLPGPLDIEEQAHLEQAAGFMKAVASLKQDAEWVKKVREQHEILRIASGAREPRVELGYLTSRTEMPSAKVQSLLNDFGAEGYIDVTVDEEADALYYTFPRLDYSRRRFQRNMALLESLEPAPSGRISLWIFVALFATILLIVIIFLRL
ncbi:hypothetical protein DL240_01795 [Lujinxingia litoralis]|uniref:Uncharacterized protein n=1 Tax=Lujinxingia litoralis TaxID=2211119 RepID=A0A328CAH8_9DELT|nr:hypothetical protein [Lujinxingia litoralis]RAL24968.1 hypothetical protein DL240_01795 [Lujinxingia litoralis]